MVSVLNRNNNLFNSINVGERRHKRIENLISFPHKTPKQDCAWILNEADYIIFFICLFLWWHVWNIQFYYLNFYTLGAVREVWRYSLVGRGKVFKLYHSSNINRAWPLIKYIKFHTLKIEHLTLETFIYVSNIQ